MGKRVGQGVRILFWAVFSTICTHKRPAKSDTEPFPTFFGSAKQIDPKLIKVFYARKVERKRERENLLLSVFMQGTLSSRRACLPEIIFFLK